MKKAVKILAAATAAVMIFLLLPLTSSALNAEDWKIVTYDGTTKDHAKLSVTETGGIRLETEGHYPTTYAGLVYSKPLDIKKGITMDVTIEELTSDSADVWFSMQLLNNPVCFDYRGLNEGKGIWFLQRPGTIDYNIIGGSSAGSQKPGDLVPGKDFYEPGTTIRYEFKIEDNELNIYIDGVQCTGNFTPALSFFEDGQCYIGFSTSETGLSHQSFVINYINGEPAASEGHLDQSGDTAETEAPLDFDNIDSFTLIDFTDPKVLTKLGAIHDCKLEFDEENGCLKVTVTGEDPHFNIPMTKARYFDGEKFTVLRMNYKTDVECESGFYFTTQTVPSEDYCSVIYDLDAAPDFTDVLVDMDESSNWLGQVRSLRIDPTEAGQDGQVFYYRSITMEVYVEEETTSRAAESDKATDPAPDDTTVSAEPGTTADKAPASDDKTDNEKKTGKSGAWIPIVIGAAVVVAAAAAAVVILKKKKK